jgi:Predicted N6-adenine-specific DNA methylase
MYAFFNDNGVIMKYKLSVCCASGIESITKKELSKMGFNDPLAINGRIAVEGDAKDIFKLNTCLRTAERVLLTLASAKATSFDDLFNIVYDIDWKNYLPHDARIIVTGKSVKSQIFAISASQKIVKKAIIKKNDR